MDSYHMGAARVERVGAHYHQPQQGPEAIINLVAEAAVGRRPIMLAVRVEEHPSITAGLAEG